MMKFRNLMQLTLMVTAAVAILFCGGACVSVSLGPKAGVQSKGVQYAVPPAPYQPLKHAHADGAWQNSANGNSISYFSTCNDPAEPSLESVSREIFAELKELKQIRQANITYNAREALDQEVEGKVDGVVTRIRALVFKKNGCTYTLSFIGLPGGFESDRAIFEAFLKGFIAP